MSFKIYFAGSMRAGRDDAPLYKLIVEHLKKHGTVLSEWTAYDRNEGMISITMLWQKIK